MTNPSPGDDATRDVISKADAFAASMPATTTSFAGDVHAFDRELRGLLEAVQQCDSRLVFDREGRPAALGAIRSALPTLERDLFDAVIEDHEAEIAAWREAMYQGLLAHGRSVAQRVGPRKEV